MKLSNILKGFTKTLVKLEAFDKETQNTIEANSADIDKLHIKNNDLAMERNVAGQAIFQLRKIIGVQK